MSEFKPCPFCGGEPDLTDTYDDYRGSYSIVFCSDIMKTREDVLRIAAAEVGVVESPAGSNRTKYGKWFGLDGQPWCMMFVQWCFAQAGFSLYRTASCSALTSRYKAAGQWVTWGFKPGDIVMFDFSGKKKITQHVGICVAEDPVQCTVTTIEGNTSLTNQDNGGAVMRRVRNVKLITGACRPGYNR